jgi:outer membrane biosynthesis protein TonB
MRYALTFCALLLLAACSREDARYLPASELDAKPFPLRPVPLEFPQVTGNAEYYGKLKLHVFINASGGVDKVDVIEAGVPASFRDAAVKAFTEVRWEPARKAGNRVKSLKVVEVDFQKPVEAKSAPMRPD